MPFADPADRQRGDQHGGIGGDEMVVPLWCRAATHALHVEGGELAAGLMSGADVVGPDMPIEQLRSGGFYRSFVTSCWFQSRLSWIGPFLPDIGLLVALSLRAAPTYDIVRPRSDPRDQVAAEND